MPRKAKRKKRKIISRRGDTFFTKSVDIFDKNLYKNYDSYGSFPYKGKVLRGWIPKNWSVSPAVKKVDSFKYPQTKERTYRQQAAKIQLSVSGSPVYESPEFSSPISQQEENKMFEEWALRIGVTDENILRAMQSQPVKEALWRQFMSAHVQFEIEEDGQQSIRVASGMNRALPSELNTYHDILGFEEMGSGKDLLERVEQENITIKNNFGAGQLSSIKARVVNGRL